MFKFLKIHKKIISLMCMFLVLINTVGLSKPNNENNKKIHKNIYIEQICIEGMTKEESRVVLFEKFKLKPLLITYKDKSWIINPEDIELYYDIEGALDKAFYYTHNEDNIDNIRKIIGLYFNDKYIINLETRYNEVKLSEEIKKICDDINVSMKNATIQISDSEEIIRTKSKEGLEVEIIKLKENIYDMIINHNIDKIDLPVKVINPFISTEDVESIDTVLSQYSTSFNHNTARGNNINVAAKCTSDIILLPQEIFSYNTTTGYRSWSNGYKTAKVIVGGKYVNGEGGGVCQVSTTIFNAALLAGMEIEEVHSHTIRSRYAPIGRDAAVSYGYTDLKFKNGYIHPIYIKNIINKGIITSKIYGSSKDREKIYIKTEEKYNKDNIQVKTYRVYLDEENNKIREELITDSIYKSH